MLESRLLKAFYSVAKLQQFEAAAQALHLTQSAVSQRVKQLEEQVGQVLLVRSNPIRMTEAGSRLLSYIQKVALLDDQLQRDLQLAPEGNATRISIGVNEDSMATWFWPAIEPLLANLSIKLDLIMEDQDRTVDLMKNGLAQAAISSRQTPLQGAKSTFLGNVPYFLAASPEYQTKYFSKGVSRSTLTKATTAVFGQHDELTFNYLSEMFGVSRHEVQYHTLPSTAAFEQIALAGAGYAVLPQLQIQQHLNSGRLVNLAPNKVMDLPLYLHHWSLHNQALDAVITHIKSTAKATLGATQ